MCVMLSGWGLSYRKGGGERIDVVAVVVIEIVVVVVVVEVDRESERERRLTDEFCLVLALWPTRNRI